MARVIFTDRAHAGHRQDRVHEACLAVARPPAGAAAWEAEIRALCPTPCSVESNLAACGDPVEFQFVWSADEHGVDTRVTADPDPEGSAHARRQRCLDLAPPLASRQHALLERWLRFADGAAWRYGGWIGSRFRDDRFVHKLYLEIPGTAAAKDGPLDGLSILQGLPVRGVVPIMLGFDPNTDGVEIYSETAPVLPDALTLLCGRFGLPGQSRRAIGLLEKLMQQRISARMPSAEQGLSLATDGEGTVTSLTWHAHADALLGPPAKARQALLVLGDALGWSMEAYAALSRPDDTGRVPWHGVIGLSIDRRAGVLLSVTCSTRPGDWQ